MNNQRVTNMTYERNYNLLNGKFKELFVPTLMASIAGNFAILADAFLISLFMGPLNLFVIQSIEPFACIVNVIYWLIGFGGSILCTHARAEFDDEKGNELFTTSLIIIVLIGLFLTVTGLLFPDFFMQILCHSDYLKPLVMQYFQLFIIGIPFLCYLTVLAYFIKTDNFIKLQFRSFLLANVVNVIFDVIFMKFLNMGISGAALATTTGFFVASIYITTYFFNSEGTLKLIKIKTSKMATYIVDIFKTGFSSASIPLYQALKLLFINMLLSGILGKVGLAAFNMCFNTLSLVTIFILGTAQSILPIVSVYYKEGDFNGIDYVTRKSLKIVTGFGIFFSLLFAIFPQAILFLFSVNDPSQIPVIMNAVRIFSLCYLGYSINLLYLFYAPSVEYDKLANAISLLEGLILPVALTYLFNYLWGINGIWIAFAVAEMLTALFIFAYSRYVTKKTNGEYSGFFIIKNNSNEKMTEFTVKGTVEEAVTLSEDVRKYFLDTKFSVFVSLAIEEILVYIVKHNEKLDWIDVIIRENDDTIVISIKDAGTEFDPTQPEELKSENIDLLNQLAENIDHSQILGLNNTVITLKK